MRSALALAASFSTALGQQRFSNFETPQTHPIEIVTTGSGPTSADYVLVCNTPDNSVDIYEAAPPHAFLQRVPVGMGPGTVRWNRPLGRFYTCNFDGDSVSVVRLDPTASGSIHAVLERTVTLSNGDEPADIAFDPTNASAAISLSSSSSRMLVNPLTLVSAGGPARLTATDPVSSLPFAVKMPRSIAWLSDGRFFAANLRGGSPSSALAQYDLGIYREDAAFSSPSDFTGGLGSTNHAFAINAAGTLMFVVGTKAQNHSAVGVQAVSQLKTGFVQSWLMVVDIPVGAAMSVRPEAPVGTPAPLLQSINLNRDYTSAPLAEVPTALALVQPTDVLLIENGGAISSIVLSAYHSDRVAILSPSNTTAGGYAVRRVTIPVLNPGSSYTVSGPRGLAFSALNNRLFVCDRLDNTLSVIDPTAATLTAQLQLPNDPTPADIRVGRQFLYSNRFSIDDSGTPNLGGFVSCAACHVDGRTDGLPWDLGGLALGPAIPPEFHDHNSQTVSSMPNFPTEKGPMVTQTLQGLVNYPISENFQFAATNAPYHWRGDKGDFRDFNEAFVNLQRMDNVSTPADPKGVSDADMLAYRRFINTILHPPNPEQDLTRVTPGTLDANNPNDPTLATGGKLGEMLFHDFAMINFRACVDCHFLPDGSTNTSTLTFPILKTISAPGTPQLHPLETAGLRNIAQREMTLHTSLSTTVDQFTANSGLLHPGDPTFLGLASSYSINLFIQTRFTMPGPTSAQQAAQSLALTQFVRQLDTGTAPLAGFAYTVDPTLSPLDSGRNRATFDMLEAQVAEANIGLGVYTRNGGTVRGYWFDCTLATPAYREEGTANLLTRASVLALALGTDNVVIAQGTPLGTERRWANPSGIATLISDPSNLPQNIVLAKMAPNTAFVDIPKFNLNLNINPFAPGDSSVWSERTLQNSVKGRFGTPVALRHEPPRRFRVTGDFIRPGAKLLLAVASGSSPASTPVQTMTMDLYPTTHVSNNRHIWETLLELDATQTFALLNGGYWAPEVANTLLRTPSGTALDPLGWNWFLVTIQNEDGTLGNGSPNWQRLGLQDNR